MLKGHGGNPRDAALKTLRNTGKIIDFSANINPFVTNVKPAEWMKAGAKKIGVYPDPEYFELRTAIAKHCGLRMEKILPGNGSTEILYLIPRALKCKRALIITPSYADYEDACRMAGTRLKRFALKPSNNFAFDAGEFAKTVRGFDLAIIGNPNNPTGGLIPRRTLLEIIKANPRTFFLIDESFINFLRGETLLSGRLCGNLIVLRSFTKFYGMPGLRLGFAAAGGRIIEKLLLFKEPWTVNCMAESFILHVLKSAPDVQKAREKIEKERFYLFSKISAFPELQVFSGEANFLLLRIKAKKWDAPRLKKKLAGKGILIRDCSNFKGLGKFFFRVAVKKRSDNNLLLKAIAECF